MAKSFYWHDYETFGTDPKRDRPIQFAGIRTDLDFNVISDPLVIYSRPAIDCIPDPIACLITGITPQEADQKGVCEAEFIAQILEQMIQPETCSLGYNNVRFDDEVTRNALYRNLYDPYSREWQNGNSRWDLIDVVRAAWALRPDGISWPLDEEQRPVFKLEALTEANDIEHYSAHDALSDVLATIEIAKLINRSQPKLYRFLFDHRTKHEASNLLKQGSFVPVVHVSGRYPVRKHCMAVVLPLCRHPTNNNGIIVYDLSVDPEPLFSLSIEEIKQRIFVASEDMPEGIERIPLKTVHINKCPVLTPINVLRKQDLVRLEIDLGLCDNNLNLFKSQQGIEEKVCSVFADNFQDGHQESDPDLMIYSGGFFSDSDKREMAKIHRSDADELSKLPLIFQDSRLTEMFFRYRARNYPGGLSEHEEQRWYANCKNRLLGNSNQQQSPYETFKAKLSELQNEESSDMNILDSVEQFVENNIVKLTAN